MLPEEERINAKRPKRSTRGIKPSRYRDEDDELDEGLAPVEKKKKKKRGGTTSMARDLSKWKSTLQTESNELLRELSSNSMHQIDSLDDPTSPSGSQSSKCNEPMHFDDCETAPPAPFAPPTPPAADDNLPASPSNSTDTEIASRAEHNKLAETVEQLRAEISALKTRSFALTPTPHTPGQVELKSGNGKIFQVEKDCFTKACAALTLQAVVKSVASGLTSGPNDTVYFRGGSKEEAIIQREFITDLIVVTRLALRKQDKFSRQPVLRIMREGESVGMVKRNQNEADAPNSTEMPVDQRRTWFSSQLTYDKVKSWTSAGFRESRRNKTQK